LDARAAGLYLPLGAANWLAYRRSFYALTASSVSERRLKWRQRAGGNTFREQRHAFCRTGTAKMELWQIFVQSMFGTVCEM